MATPEERARARIDRMLDASGWEVQDFRTMDLSAGPAIAVREFPLKTGEADYGLYAAGKVIGVVEAKPEGHTLTGVEIQSAKYLSALPQGIPRWTDPGKALPFAYESTGAVTQFTSTLDPDPRSREVFTFHRPEELIRLATLNRQLRAGLTAMPPLETQRLWDKQVTAIENLERSLADNRPRALIQMVMGSGKTFTACNIAYRLIKFAGAKRILFLVDRNNLGNGSLTEIGRSAIWRGEIPNCVHQNHIIRVRPLSVLTGFVNMYWNSPNGVKRVMAEAASTSGLYTLSVTKVCRLPVPIPPLAEQAEIVAEVDRRLSVADAAEVQVEHALQRAARLRQAILKRAFEGRLVGQDPADEPAATLLERIKSGSSGNETNARNNGKAADKPAIRRRRALA